jgi:hypothetical protein
MESEGSVLSSHESATDPYPEPDESNTLILVIL